MCFEVMISDHEGKHAWRSWQLAGSKQKLFQRIAGQNVMDRDGMAQSVGGPQCFSLPSQLDISCTYPMYPCVPKIKHTNISAPETPQVPWEDPGDLTGTKAQGIGLLLLLLLIIVVVVVVVVVGGTAAATAGVVVVVVVVVAAAQQQQW